MSDERWWFLYRWFDEDDALLYVGITAEPRQREREHRKGSWWTRFAVRVEVDPPRHISRNAAEAWELAVIANEAPVFNQRKALDPHNCGRDYLTRRLTGEELATALARLPPHREPGQWAAKGTKIRPVRISDDLWEDAGKAAALLDADRSTLIRQYLEWIAWRPGVEAPVRPPIATPAVDEDAA